MIFPRQLPIGLPNLFGIRVTVHPECLVIVLFGCRRHFLFHSKNGGLNFLETAASLRTSGLLLPASYFLSSTSTNSASTTLSFGCCCCCAPCAPSAAAPAPAAPFGPAALCDLYIASANLWLAVVNLSVAALILSSPPSAIAFLTSSTAASTCFASASEIL